MSNEHLNQNQLNGKTALITGSSRGIGREIALKLAQLGADIVVSYVGNEESAQKTRQEIEKLGRSCSLVKCDLSSANCVEIIAQVIEKVDILILNASVQYRKKWTEITCKEFDDQINCNLRSSLLLAQYFAPKMVEQKWGRIVTIGSVQEQKPHPDMLVYSASKVALTLFARSLAAQLAPSGVTVNSVAPGVILTDRNTEALQNEEYYKLVLNKIPLGFCGEASDCAGIVAFLCTDDARYITAQNIFVDGGMGM